MLDFGTRVWYALAPVFSGIRRTFDGNVPMCQGIFHMSLGGNTQAALPSFSITRTIGMVWHIGTFEGNPCK